MITYNHFDICYFLRFGDVFACFRLVWASFGPKYYFTQSAFGPKYWFSDPHVPKIVKLDAKAM